jgi:hypothetical protein
MSLNSSELALNLTESPMSSRSSQMLTTGLVSSLLLPMPAIQPSRSSSSLADYLNQVQGTLTFNRGTLVSALNTPLGRLDGTFDLNQLITSANNYVRTTSGTLNLAGGIAAGNLTIASQTFTGSFDFAGFAADYVSSLVKDIKGTQPFERGILNLNLPTQFGPIVGSVDFGTGKLITDLDTPLGKLQTTIDIPDSVTVPFNFNGIKGNVDLGKGNIEIDTLDLVPGPELVVPLSSLSGTFAFDAGSVKIDVPTPLGRLQTSVDLSGLLADTLTDTLTAATGTLTIADGKLGADVTSSLGSFKGTIDVAQLLNTYGPALAQAEGTLTFNGGVLVSTLTTPQGSLAGTFNYGRLLS